MQAGGLRREDLDASLEHPELIGKMFHLVVRRGDTHQFGSSVGGGSGLNLHVASSPVDCEQYTYCWRRAMFLLQQIDDVLAAIEGGASNGVWQLGEDG